MTNSSADAAASVSRVNKTGGFSTRRHERNEVSEILKERNLLLPSPSDFAVNPGLVYFGSVMRLLAGIFAVHLAFASPLPFQVADEHHLVWQEGVSLNWDDFQGEPGAAGRPYQGAESRLTIALRFSCTNSVPDFKVWAEFDRSNSWARPNMPASLLEHEQIHFDIAELYARGTRKAFDDVRNPCGNPSAVEDISDHNNELSARAQQNYDEETLHGTLPGAKAAWTRKIRALLEASNR